MAFDQKEYNKKYYKKNKEYLNKRSREYSKIWGKNNKDKLKENSKKWRSKNPLRDRYIVYKSSARKRGLVFEIDYETFLDLVNSKCFYCGEDGFGIDRLDSDNGYIDGNYVPACKACNKMKMDLSVDEFLEKCVRVTNNLIK